MKAFSIRRFSNNDTFYVLVITEDDEEASHSKAMMPGSSSYVQWGTCSLTQFDALDQTRRQAGELVSGECLGVDKSRNPDLIKKLDFAMRQGKLLLFEGSVPEEGNVRKGTLVWSSKEDDLPIPLKVTHFTKKERGVLSRKLLWHTGKMRWWEYFWDWLLESMVARFVKSTLRLICSSFTHQYDKQPVLLISLIGSLVFNLYHLWKGYYGL